MMRAVARGKAEHEASHTVMALHYGQAIRAVTIDPAEGGQGAMYRWQPKETPINVPGSRGDLHTEGMAARPIRTFLIPSVPGSAKQVHWEIYPAQYAIARFLHRP